MDVLIIFILTQNKAEINKKHAWQRAFRLGVEFLISRVR